MPLFEPTAWAICAAIHAATQNTAPPFIPQHFSDLSSFQFELQSDALSILVEPPPLGSGIHRHGTHLFSLFLSLSLSLLGVPFEE